MSLEEALNRNSDAVEKQNSLLEKMLAKAGVNTAAAGKTDDAGEGDAPKKTRATKGKAAKEAEDAGEGEGGEGDENTLSHDDVKKLAGAWLGEFKANEKDPETGARREAIKGALAKLVGKDGATIADVAAADLSRVVAWLDKQKAKGRLTPEPKEDDGEEI